MEMVFTFVLSVAAGIVAYYICKWLDDHLNFKWVRHFNRCTWCTGDNSHL